MTNLKPGDPLLKRAAEIRQQAETGVRLGQAGEAATEQARAIRRQGEQKAHPVEAGK